MKAVIFDLDGTILDTIYDLKEAVNYALNQLDYPNRSLAEIREFIGNGLVNLMIRSLGKNKVDEEVSKSVELFTEYYKSHLVVFTKEFPKVKELLIMLKEQGFKIGVLSNKDDYAVKLLCDEFYKGLIDVCSGRKKDGIIKPNPLLVQNILKELNVDSAYFVGDSDTDALTAINANLEGILVSWGYEDIEVLEKFKMPIVNSCDELLALLIKLSTNVTFFPGSTPISTFWTLFVSKSTLFFSRSISKSLLPNNLN